MSLRDDLATISSKVRRTSPEVRLLKIGEEYGEAVSAAIGVGGWNPHKGQYGTSADVAAELADVVLSALIAMADHCIEPVQVVTRRAAEVAERASVGVTEPASRDPHCVEQWPECESGGYDPRCCRFPKSCSCSHTNDLTEPASSASGGRTRVEHHARVDWSTGEGFLARCSCGWMGQLTTNGMVAGEQAKWHEADATEEGGQG